MKEGNESRPVDFILRNHQGTVITAPLGDLQYRVLEPMRLVNIEPGEFQQAKGFRCAAGQSASKNDGRISSTTFITNRGDRNTGGSALVQPFRQFLRGVPEVRLVARRWQAGYRAKP